MRDLPDQLKEVSTEVTRASQEPEVTRTLIKNTSENLQVLVSNLQDKVFQFIEDKGNTGYLLVPLAQVGYAGLCCLPSAHLFSYVARIVFCHVPNSKG